MPIEVTLTNEQQYRVLAAPVTATGKPASLDGPLRATLVTGEGVVAAGASDLEVVLQTGDNPGDATFLIEADADLGEGVTLIQDTVTLHVEGAQAAALGLTGSVEAKP